MHGNFLSSILLSVIQSSFIPPKLWQKLKHLRDTKRGLSIQQVVQESIKFFGFFRVFLSPLKSWAPGSFPGWTGESSWHSCLEIWLEKLHVDHDCTPCQKKLTQRPQVYRQRKQFVQDFNGRTNFVLRRKLLKKTPHIWYATLYKTRP